MANWMSLIAEVHRVSAETSVAAVSIESTKSQRAYWNPVSDAGVQLLTTPDVTSFVQQVGTNTVPSTIVIRDDRIIETYEGILGPVRRARVLALLK
jgi:hypothetical protein